MDLIDRLKAEMAAEFARTGPPDGFPKFPDIPAGRYTSDEFWDLEQRHLWSSRLGARRTVPRTSPSPATT